MDWYARDSSNIVVGSCLEGYGRVVQHANSARIEAYIRYSRSNGRSGATALSQGYIFRLAYETEERECQEYENNDQYLLKGGLNYRDNRHPFGASG